MEGVSLKRIWRVLWLCEAMSMARLVVACRWLLVIHVVTLILASKLA
jgi:hypothetical protein